MSETLRWPMGPIGNPPEDVAFIPSRERGQLLDAAVRCRFADSIDGIVGALDGALGVDREALAALTASIRAHPVRPAVTGLYASLVPALLEDEPRARAMLAVLADPRRRDHGDFRITTIADAELGDGISAIYDEHMNDQPDVAILFRPLEVTAMTEARRRAEDAMALLEAADPALAGEIRALVNEILLVRHDAEAGGIAFHGASTFYLWGALVLNIDAFPTRLALAEGLAHEAAHTLLHGLTMGQTTVLNDPAELYPSPLREDPRPMEGVVHATFVLARMHLAMAAVLGVDKLDAAERDAAAHQLDEIRRAFGEGLRTVASAARFTERGAAAFAGARAHMARAAGVSLDAVPA